METPYIVSVQVGRPRTFGMAGARDPLERPWMTATFKDPVAGPVWLGQTNLAGDAQADTKNHGGADKAVLLYAAAHYPLWRRELGRPDMPHGGFGENFTVVGLTEEDVCIGDSYAIGDARVQVSQPRQPCWKQARRWRVRDLVARMQDTGRTGWYVRVLREGLVAPGQSLLLLDRPYPEWTVARSNGIMHQRRGGRAAASALAACPLLSANWQTTLSSRVRATGDATPDRTPRLVGSPDGVSSDVA